MSHKGTPASSQIVWLEKRVEELTAAHEIATNTLKIAVERIEQLTSGPGGIMEMKQTIADKEQHIEKLEAALDDVAGYLARADWYYLKPETRKALEGKDD